MTRSSRRRIVVVARHRLYADSVRVALALRGHHCCVRVTEGLATAVETLTDIRRAQAPVALLDLDLSDSWEGVDLVAPVVGSGTAVVVVTDSTDPDLCREALERGARDVLPKSCSLDTISRVVRQVSTGDAVLPSARLPAVARSRPRRDVERDALRERLLRLTERENQILAHLMAGHTVTEIARAGVVSEATVRTQVRSILAKLEVSSQLAAVSIAHRVGWTPVNDELGRRAATPAREAGRTG